MYSMHVQLVCHNIDVILAWFNRCSNCTIEYTFLFFCLTDNIIVVPGLLPEVGSWHRNIMHLPVCAIVEELYAVNCIPLEGLDIMLDFKQMTHGEMNGSLIMATRLPLLYKYSLNLLCFFGMAISSCPSSTSFLNYRLLHQIMWFNQRFFGIHPWELQDRYCLAKHRSFTTNLNLVMLSLISILPNMYLLKCGLNLENAQLLK
jgi:hypothetical protein